MNAPQLFDALQKADTIADLGAALSQFEAEHACEWIPVGGKPNNSGIINVASDPGRSLVERLTNAVDAVLEREYEVHNGKPDCRSPRKAASTWLGIPPEGLSGLTTRQRQQYAENVLIRLTDGEGRREARTVEVRDAR